MALSSGLVFAAVCLLCIASSEGLKSEVPKCEQLGAEGLGEHERDIVVDVFKRALKNADQAGYSCPLEISAKFFVFIPNHVKWYDVDVLRYEIFESLVEQAMQKWSSKLEVLTGAQTFGCNYGVTNGQATLVCLVGPGI
ncbi:hypothetical protein Aduo_019651 [Ancylostoma duodenale]